MGWCFQSRMNSRMKSKIFILSLNSSHFWHIHYSSHCVHIPSLCRLVKPFSILLQWKGGKSFHSCSMHSSNAQNNSFHRVRVCVCEFVTVSNSVRTSIRELNTFVEIPLREPCFRFVSLPWIFGDSYKVFDWYGMSSRTSLVCNSLLFSLKMRIKFLVEIVMMAHAYENR